MHPDLRLATLDDLKWIDVVARKNTEELGFLPRVVVSEAVKRGWVHVHPQSYSFVVFHVRKDGVTTVGYLCVFKGNRGKGVGRLLVESVPRPVQLKCPAFLPSNDFYKHLGFVFQGFEQNGKRPVNLWRLE